MYIVYRKNNVRYIFGMLYCCKCCFYGDLMMFLVVEFDFLDGICFKFFLFWLGMEIFNFVLYMLIR